MPKQDEGRAMRESMEKALSLDVDCFMDSMNNDSLSVQDRIAVAMCAEAMGGNVRAAQYVRDVMGGFEEKPKVEVKVTAFDKIAKQYQKGASRKPNAKNTRSA